MLAFVLNEVVKGDGLGADVALLEIGVDDASGLRAGVAHMDGPRAYFFHTRCEVGLQTQERVSGADEAVQAGLALAQLLQELQAVCVVHLGQLGFDLGADGHHRRVLRLRKGFQAIEEGVVFKAIFRHVGHKHGGLGGDEEKLLQFSAFFFAEVDGAHRLGVVQGDLAFLQNGQLLGGFFVARAGNFAHAVNGFFNRAQVGQTQLGLNHFNVGNRVHFVGHMDDVVVFKATHHIHDGIGFADVRQKLVAQAFTGAGTGHQPGDVHKLDDGGHDALWRDDLRQLLQTRVGHFHHAHIRLDGAEGVVFSRDTRFGEGVEQGGLAYVGQAHDAAFQTHNNPWYSAVWGCARKAKFYGQATPTIISWLPTLMCAFAVVAWWAAAWRCCWPANGCAWPCWAAPRRRMTFAPSR